MPLQPDDLLENKYRIIRLLGEGGMGAVYEGLNVRIKRRVAIKVLHGDARGNSQVLERFEREAQAAGRIGSKHIVQVLDLGDLPQGERYMVMEYLDGVDLTRRIRSLGKMEPRELYPIAVQILEGLVAAHQAGIVHRDLKPDNIFIVPEGEHADFVKILDFGISKFQSGNDFSMTKTGVVMGTPYYMSPEQAKGTKDVDHRTDIYSLGVIMFEALSGQVPFSAETFNALMLKIVLEEPRQMAEPRNDEERAFHAIVRKAMARSLTERYQTAAEFQGDLHDWARVFEVPLSSVVQRRSNFPPGTTPMLGTQRTWAQTNSRASATSATEPAPAPSEALPTRKAGPWPYVLAALVVAIGIAAWFAVRGSPAEAQDPPALAPSSSAPERQATSTGQVAAPLPAGTPSAASAGKPTAPPDPAASGGRGIASPPDRVPAEASTRTSPPAKPKDAPQAVSAPPPAEPETKPTEPSEAKPKSNTTSSGRMIRTEL